MFDPQTAIVMGARLGITQHLIGEINRRNIVVVIKVMIAIRVKFFNHASISAFDLSRSSVIANSQGFVMVDLLYAIACPSHVLVD
jgi:hypothetical protein